MFAMVMSFDGESERDLADGMAHVQDEVIPALQQCGGVTAWWLVDKEAGCRVTVMVWESDEQYQAGMARIGELRAQHPDRNRPAPTSVQRLEVYGSVPG